MGSDPIFGSSALSVGRCRWRRPRISLDSSAFEYVAAPGGGVANWQPSGPPSRELGAGPSRRGKRGNPRADSRSSHSTAAADPCEVTHGKGRRPLKTPHVLGGGLISPDPIFGATLTSAFEGWAPRAFGAASAGSSASTLLDGVSSRRSAARRGRCATRSRDASPSRGGVRARVPRRPR